jgi:nucleotide-binding universal stress UspA family protein
VLGSTAQSVAASARCPVAVVPVRQLGRAATRRVVVGVDEGSGSHDAIGFAFAQADLRGKTLTAVHSWHAPDRLGIAGVLTPSGRWQTMVGNEEAAMAESLAGWTEKYPDVEVSRVSIRRPPAAAVLTVADDAELIVLGSRHPRPRPDLVGSPTVRRVVQDARCPVVVVPEASR